MTTGYPKKKLNYKPEGRINIGRPLRRWEDDFQEEGTGQGMMMIYFLSPYVSSHRHYLIKF